MKPIRIDFGQDRHPWRWSWQLRSVHFFLLAVLCAGLVIAAVSLRARQMEQELAQAQEALAQLENLRQKNALRQHASERRTPEEEVMEAQSQRLRALPWEAIFQAVEAPEVAVRLQSFEPDPVRGILKLQAKADDLAAMQAYVQALQQSPVFRGVALQRHAIAENAAGVEFACEAVLAAAYRLPEVTEGRP